MADKLQPDDLVSLHDAAVAVGSNALYLGSRVRSGQLRSFERVSLAEAKALADQLRQQGHELKAQPVEMIRGELEEVQRALAKVITSAQFWKPELPFPMEDLERLEAAVRRRVELLQGAAR